MSSWSRTSGRSRSSRAGARMRLASVACDLSKLARSVTSPSLAAATMCLSHPSTTWHVRAPAWRACVRAPRRRSRKSRPPRWISSSHTLWTSRTRTQASCNLTRSRQSWLRRSAPRTSASGSRTVLRSSSDASRRSRTSCGSAGRRCSAAVTTWSVMNESLNATRARPCSGRRFLSSGWLGTRCRPSRSSKSWSACSRRTLDLLPCGRRSLPRP
mmetsp:Transcript_2601/g.3886  ORF Transcript_2601/g.3886 Transcript_2601/m.3886 type:complete len:214 (+) Transcript_2601:980-1621(+)